MQMISGTIKSAVKLDVLLGKWEQKKETKDWRKDPNLTDQEKMLCQFREDLINMREGNRLEEISSKIRSGQDLTSEEIEYLQKECPQLYRDYVEIKNEKEAYERKLKNCETKEEVDRLKVNQMGQYVAQAKKTFNNPNIPLSEKYRIACKILGKISGISEVEAEFKASAAYKELESEQDIRRREHAEAEASEELAKELGESETENVVEEGGETADEESTGEDGEGISGGATTEKGTITDTEATDLPSDTEGVINLVADLWNAQRPVGGGAAYIDAGEILGDIEKPKKES